MAKELLHIQQGTLVNMGFKCDVDFDRNLPTDNFDTLRFDTYVKKISDTVSIRIKYTFIAATKGLYELKSTVVELVVGDSFAPINVTTLWSIRHLISILEGHD